MEDEESQQFSLKWHNHQNSMAGALGSLLCSQRLADVTLCADGQCLHAHKLVLASCSEYFTQLFKELEGAHIHVVMVGCRLAELRLLLQFMYTGEVTADQATLPALLQLAVTLGVSGLTNSHMDTAKYLQKSATKECNRNDFDIKENIVNSDVNNNNHCFNVHKNINETNERVSVCNQLKNIYGLGVDETNYNKDIIMSDREAYHSPKNIELDEKSRSPIIPEMLTLPDQIAQKFNKLDRIVENLYNSKSTSSMNFDFNHNKIDTRIFDGNYRDFPPSLHSFDSRQSALMYFDRKARLQNGGGVNSSGAVCTICNKRLSNQYNLRVHLETHAGARHACGSCSHVSRSRDALRKHVAYRHPNAQKHTNYGSRNAM